MTNTGRIKWIEHKGKKILFADYSRLRGEELLVVLGEAEKEFSQLTSPALVLLDFTDSFVNNEFMTEIKRVGKTYDAMVEKAASIGIEGLKKILISAYNTFTGQAHKSAYFSSLEEAKEYLCK